jgi:hypothetical protein
MGKSSGHIGKGGGGNSSHNSRERFSFSQVFFDEENQVNRNHQDSMKMFRDLLRERSEKYTERTGQKLQKNSVTHLSTIINLLPQHNLEDLDPIVKFLEEKLDTKVFQTAVHRDEGKLVHKETGEILTSGEHFFADPKTKKHYFDKDYTLPLDLNEYEVEKNYHAHIEFMGLDSDGKSIRRELNKRFLVEYQDFLAETLGMERGQKSQSYTKEQMKEITSKLKVFEEYSSQRDYAKAFNVVAKELGYFIDKSKKAKRLDTHDYKSMKARENEILAPVLAKQKDLKVEIAKLRSELEEGGAGRTEYAELEQLNRDLKARIKNKDLTIEELQISLSSINEEKIELLDENSNLNNEVAEAKWRLAQVEEITYHQVEHWNPDTESIEVEEVPYKDLYEDLSKAIAEKKERLVELEIEFEATTEYTERLEQGYSDMEVKLFGKDKGRKIEEIVGRVSILTTIIKNASKFMKITVEQFIKHFSRDSEPKEGQNEPEEENTAECTTEEIKTLKSHSQQFETVEWETRQSVKPSIRKNR